MTDVITIDRQFLWDLRPDEIPGRLNRDLRRGDPHISVRLEVALKGPDGNILEDVELISTETLPRLIRGGLVLFRIAKIGLDEHSKQQFYVDKLRLMVSDDERKIYNDVKSNFSSSQADKMETAIKAIKQRIEERVATIVDDKMTAERDSIDKAWEEHNANRNKYEKASAEFAIERARLGTEKTDVQVIKQKLEQEKTELEQEKAKFEQAGGPELIALVHQSKDQDLEDANALPLENQEAMPSLTTDILKHLKKQNYSVDKALLIQTLLCLCVAAATGQFIVLTGPPGSGKTSLVQKISKAIGAGNGVVPVRPAWIDSTDLIGFYNPGIKRYQPTPFLDYFLQAKRYDKLNRLYLLVLDEMNLGRVENYAADFLSLMEKAREGDDKARLQLYSREIEAMLSKENNAEIKAHILTYSSRLPFPQGLILFGTINVDETTYLPSPKFLDRALTIQVSGTQLLKNLPDLYSAENETPEAGFSWSLSLEIAKCCSTKGNNLTPDAQKTWEILVDWNENYFKPLGIRLSHRLPQVYRCYMGAASVLGITDHKMVADTFVLSKIMPLISFRDGAKSEVPDTGTKRSVLEQWRDDAETKTSFPIVHASLEAICKRVGLIVRYLE